MQNCNITHFCDKTELYSTHILPKIGKKLPKRCLHDSMFFFPISVGNDFFLQVKCTIVWLNRGFRVHMVFVHVIFPQKYLLVLYFNQSSLKALLTRLFVFVWPNIFLDDWGELQPKTLIKMECFGLKSTRMEKVLRGTF